MGVKLRDISLLIILYICVGVVITVSFGRIALEDRYIPIGGSYHTDYILAPFPFAREEIPDILPINIEREINIKEEYGILGIAACVLYFVVTILPCLWLKNSRHRFLFVLGFLVLYFLIVVVLYNQNHMVWDHFF